jgi:uncharacterized protein YpuA (DUF1002 family)
MKKTINETEYNTEDLIEKTIKFVEKTNNIDLETRVHAVKSILYKVYHINVNYSVIQQRMKRRFP